MQSRQPVKAILFGAGATVVTLFGETLLGVLVGELVFELLPGHRLGEPSPVAVTLAAIPAVAGLLTAGATWGLLMGKLARSSQRRRVALAGMLGFAPTTFVLAFTSISLESVVAAALEPRLPVHRLFSLVFVSIAFLIATISTWAVCRGLRVPDRPWRLALPVGLASAAAFLTVNLAMEAAGWVVGAPGAEERATMLTVMFSGMLAAGLVGGGLLGRGLAGRPTAHASAETASPHPPADPT